MLQYYTHLAEFQPALAMARHDFLLEKQTRKSENFMQIMSDSHRSIAKSCEKIQILASPKYLLTGIWKASIGF